jgi:lysophospholipase L1-like esterase
MSRSLVAVFALAALPSAAADFAIRDGDTVGFLGDSITAARAYGKLIENYTLLRFPERRVRFVNVGKGGETAAGAVERLEKDVFGRGVTLLTVAYGINDIGWGLRADEEHKRKYLKGIETIVKRCRERGVRVYICSAAVTGADPAKSEGDYLQKMCDEGMEVSRRNGGEAIDVQRTMREIQKRVWEANEKAGKKEHSLHAADGVHLNDLGQVAMGFAILKGLGAPDDVSAVEIDAAEMKVASAEGCEVTDLKGGGERIEFVRLDKGLPLNAETFFALHFRFVPIPDRLNRYMLTVKGLGAGEYAVFADGRALGKWSGERLGAGVNIASVTSDPWQPGGPWDAQANVLATLTESRDKLDLAGRLAGHHFGEGPLPKGIAADVARTNEQIEELQRSVARPRPYRFVIERVAGEPAGR